MLYRRKFTFAYGSRITCILACETRMHGTARVHLAAAGARDVAALALGDLRDRHGGGHSNREVVKAEGAHHGVGVGVDLERRNRRVEGRDLRHVLVLALALLLLELERDAAHGATLDAAHKVRGEAGNLVAEALRGHDGNLIDHLLVGVEVHRIEARVVLLDEDARGALGRLSADATLALVCSRCARARTCACARPNLPCCVVRSKKRWRHGTLPGGCSSILSREYHMQNNFEHALTPGRATFSSYTSPNNGPRLGSGTYTRTAQRADVVERRSGQHCQRRAPG